MLQFNPGKRLSAEEALKDTFFDDVRIPQQESMEVLTNIDLTFDEEELSPEEVRELVIKEIKSCIEMKLE